MRELNECTAEVFRRSEERIKKAKRIRGRILSVCIPLCLCLTVSAVVFFESAINAQKSDKPLAMSFACSVVKAEIRDGNGTLTVKNLSDASSIYFEISDMLSAEVAAQPEISEADGYCGDKGDEECVLNSDQLSGLYESSYPFCIYAVEYDITFYTSYGDSAVYTLRGHDLTDCESGMTTTLTDEQVKALENLINEKD